MYSLHMTESEYYIHMHKDDDDTNSKLLLSQEKSPNTKEPTQTKNNYNDEEENDSQGSYKRWTEDEITEMGEMNMTIEEYCEYRNLAGIGAYSFSSAGEEAEANDLELDNKEGWFDEEIQKQEITDLNRDNEEHRIRELFEPREPSGTIKNEIVIGDQNQHLNAMELEQSKESIGTQENESSSHNESTNKIQPNNLNHPNSINVDNVQPASAASTKAKYKQVNPVSKNRRERNRDKTPESNNRTQHDYTYYTRVTFKISVKASDEPISTIKDIVKELLRELYQIDNQLSILPWKGASTLEPLSTITTIPNTVTGLNKYLHKLFVPKKGTESTIYPHIRIGHEMDFHTIREEIYSWVNNYGHGIFYNMLQEEDGVEIGWLLYSTREMDAGALADEIIDATGCNIGLRWKVISTGTKQISKDNMIRALAVECSAKIMWKCQHKLL